MKKHLLLIFLLAATCITLWGCTDGNTSDSPKIESGDYRQQVLLYDRNGTLTTDEIFSRFWRLNEDGTLQSKLETEEGFIAHGKGQSYRTSEKNLNSLFDGDDRLYSVQHLTNRITDGKRYQQGDEDILLLRNADGSVLLALLEKDGLRSTVSALFLLEPGDIPPTSSPIEYEWDPLAVSTMYNKIYGHRFTVDFQSMVNAIMNNKRSFYCSDPDNAQLLHTHAADLFPPYSQIVANVFYEDGKANIIYKSFDPAERRVYLDEFRRSIEYLINSALKQDDNEVTVAIALYHALSYQLTADAYTDPEDKTLTTYRALTEYTGSSKTFASAYAYLCNQMGISAVTAGGVSNTLISHDWTLLVLNDRYYYADPTMETLAGGTGLRYFGLTSQQRYEDHGYAAHMTSIGNTALLWGNNLDISDTRFAPVQSVVNVDRLWRTDGKLTVYGTNAKGESLCIEMK